MPRVFLCGRSAAAMTLPSSNAPARKPGATPLLPRKTSTRPSRARQRVTSSAAGAGCPRVLEVIPWSEMSLASGGQRWSLSFEAEESMEDWSMPGWGTRAAAGRTWPWCMPGRHPRPSSNDLDSPSLASGKSGPSRGSLRGGSHWGEQPQEAADHRVVTAPRGAPDALADMCCRRGAGGTTRAPRYASGDHDPPQRAGKRCASRGKRVNSGCAIPSE